MNLFGWKSGRASPRPALGRASLGPAYFGAIGGVYGEEGEGDDAPQSYEARVRRAYCANPIAQRSVRMVAEAAGTAPIRASTPAITNLVQRTSGGQALVETLAGQLLLHGNAYVQILSDADGAAAELYALRPDRVTIEPDARGWPVAFLYRAGEHVTRIAAEGPNGRCQMIHIRDHHPLDDHYGLGALGAASMAVALHNEATKWNRALLRNASRPSGALVHDSADGKPLSPMQFDQLRADLAAEFSGGANAGRPLLLDGGLKWQAIGLSPAEMDFGALKAAAARDIALAFGVPPMLLGLPGDNTYANYREANRALWRLTILPLTRRILAALAEGLARWIEGATLDVDEDRIGALAEDRERLWAMVGAADFLSDEEKKAMVRMGP